MNHKNKSNNKNTNILNILFIIIFSIIIALFLSSMIVAQDNEDNNQNDNEQTNNDNETSQQDGENQNDNDDDQTEQDEDDTEDDERRTETGDLIGYSKITIEENGKVVLTEEVYESTLEETPGIPIYTYIYREPEDPEDRAQEVPVQIKAYKVNPSRSAYILDYVINLDSNVVIKQRGVFKYQQNKRFLDYLEIYIDGRLERIEYYDENGRLIAIERFDETGRYSEYLGKEEVEYIDPYGYFKTYSYNDNEELNRFAYYYPNGELLFSENLLETDNNNLRIIYDEQTRERIVKYLNEDNQIIKEEFYNEKDLVVFYRVYEYDNNGNLEKIEIYEDIEIIKNHYLVEVTQKVIFYFDGNDNLLKRERYLDDELISTTNYGDNQSNEEENQEEDSVDVED